MTALSETAPMLETFIIWSNKIRLPTIFKNRTNKGYFFKLMPYYPRMDIKTAIQFLNFLTNAGILCFGIAEMRLWTKNAENVESLRKSIRRHCETGLFLRVHKDVCVNGLNNPFAANPFARYCLANALRPHANNWESLKSRLSQLGIISQVSNRLTFMTTGKAGVIRTVLGTFEFSHAPAGLIPDVRLFEETGILHATAEQAWKDLKLMNRNLDLVDMKTLKEEIEREKAHAA